MSGAVGTTGSGVDRVQVLRVHTSMFGFCLSGARVTAIIGDGTLTKQPSGAEGRRRKAAALARGEPPKRGKPNGTTKKVLERRAEIRKDVALITRAKEVEPFFFETQSRRTEKSIRHELKTKGGWKRGKHGDRIRDKHGNFVRDEKKYSGIGDRTLDRDIETVEHKAWRGPRKKR